MTETQNTYQTPSDLKLIANTIRGLSMDAVQKAHSGHPGLPLGMADVMAVLFSRFLRFNPGNPDWFNRDRFVLSGGHGSMLLYSLLHLYGYDLSLEDIRHFRQWKSKTPGHPEYRDAPGVETTTGPLGQGLGNAVGMAIAEKHLAARWNKEGYEIVDHYTYVEVGDGDLEEGISHEVCSLAGHLGLNKLIALYDSNQITIDGKTDLSYSEDTKQRFLSYGWEVLHANGHDYEAIETAITTARSSKDKPVLIIFDTIIGYGSPNRAGTSKAHGEPLGEEEVLLTKQALGIPPEAFYVPDALHPLKTYSSDRGRQLEATWNETLHHFIQDHPEEAPPLQSLLNKEAIPEDIMSGFPGFEAGKSLATRAASGKIIAYLAEHVAGLIGGSADLTPSNKTLAPGMTAFDRSHPEGQYIHYGVREFGMGAIMNGLRLHSGLLPYGGTFFVFSDYMRAAMRMAALMRLRVTYVLTHDSIGLGEDGPTHQPVEHLTSLRAMPGMRVIRPMDANETIYAWQAALTASEGPTCLVLTRQGVPAISRQGLGPAEDLLKGGYVLESDEHPEIILMASGSEVHLTIEAKQKLNALGKKVRIVSMPCFELFDRQDASYREQVLPADIPHRIAIEAGATMSWYKYVGLQGKVIGLDRFGASAPFKTLYNRFGITAEAIVRAALEG